MSSSEVFLSFPSIVFGAAPPQARRGTGFLNSFGSFDAVQCESESHELKM